jgi:hypothetical protein
MHDLIDLSIAAHGGFERWDRICQISATFVLDGLGLMQRGQEAFALMPARATVNTGVQKTILERFLA